MSVCGTVANERNIVYSMCYSKDRVFSVIAAESFYFSVGHQNIEK